MDGQNKNGRHNRNPKKVTVLRCILYKNRNLTFFLHSSSEALAQTTISTLIPLVFIHHAVSVEPAGVDVISPNAPAEETLAPVAAESSIMFAGGLVPADGTLLGA